MIWFVEAMDFNGHSYFQRAFPSKSMARLYYGMLVCILGESTYCDKRVPYFANLHIEAYHVIDCERIVYLTSTLE
ncbi:hypothetical protein AFV9_gp73 [Betalipothrixvirus uzonense]|uniref:Uncharacterized protein n=1 Tax=Betalipothrixvirus uzonense TaxID=512792 RepID=B2CRQ0_9VIRU|nr:hypothetical protein AFV9_gp73 [Acidianus filamentous virus 9]ACB37307.1 hypothetical protein [Acidianus filamentous virus 9]